MDGHGSAKLRTAVAAAHGTRVPDDALVEMFQLLPAKSLHRFKCVSKAWCGLVTDPIHYTRFAQTLAGFLCADVADDDTAVFGTKISGDLLARVRRHESPDFHPPACYLVCNPATARWASVMPSDWAPTATSQSVARTYLLFDAAASPHAFHLLQFRLDEMDTRAVHTYSSAEGAWTDRAGPWHDGGWREWVRAVVPIQPGTGVAVANGMLHLVVDTDGTPTPTTSSPSKTKEEMREG